MNDINAVTLFAEDFRQDVNGTTMLLGIIPDGMFVPSFPAILPKLVVYSRINLPLSFEPRTVQVMMTGPGLPDTIVGNFDPDAVVLGHAQAIENKAPYLGLVCVSIASPASIGHEGHVSVHLVIDDNATLIGDLYVRLQSQPLELVGPE